MNNWLASVKELTEDTQNELLKYFSSCKIEQQTDDEGGLRKNMYGMFALQKKHVWYV
jgi:hypothetical protein